MLAERVNHIEYAIRELVIPAKKMEASGKKVIYMNIGDPVKAGFKTPEKSIKALLNAAKDGFNYYGDSEGEVVLRKAIVEREKNKNRIKLKKEDVIVTAGISEGIIFLSGALIDRKSEVLLPGPCYPPYSQYTNFFGGKPVFYKCDEENDWEPDLTDLRKKISKKTKYMLIINPNNPTGAVYSPKTVKKMIDIAAEHNLIVVSDEIYDSLVYNEEFKSTASLTNYPVLGLNGFSKSYLVPGWRVGCMYFANADERMDSLKEAILKQTRIRLCPNTVAQHAIASVIGSGEDKQLQKELKKRRDYFCNEINNVDGLECVVPKGAFYVFPKITSKRWKNDKSFVVDFLKKEGVLFVNGSGFEKYGENHFRSTFLPPIETLEIVIKKLKKFMK